MQDAIAEANSFLEAAGLQLVALANGQSTPSPPPNPHNGGYSWRLIPSALRPFSAEEKASRRHAINRQCTAEAIAEHSARTIVEYPECSSSTDGVVVHRFAVDPANFYHPKFNIQHSFSRSHGGQSDVFCGSLLLDAEGNQVYCQKFDARCDGLKICEHYCPTYKRPPTVTSREIVFMKTLAFYVTVINTRCGLVHELDDLAYDFDAGTVQSVDSIANTPLAKVDCDGKLVLSYDHFNHPFLHCEFRGKDESSHLILRNLQDFDTQYLIALLQNNHSIIQELEQQAMTEGYGPLAPCSFSASSFERKQLCPYWHRNANGVLSRGCLQQSDSQCPVSFSIYTPQDLDLCPFIVILCRNAHNHPDPCPVKTPPSIADVFKSLLLKLEWKLADATPRKIMIDSGFMCGLRDYLQWTQIVDPCLSDLHPSLGNLDHVRRIIAKLREEKFPDGTGFKGALLLSQVHQSLPLEEQYVRCVEAHEIENNKIFELVICMSRTMSAHLMNAVHISIDTSFKRVHGQWQEFEIESWESTHMKSIVCARAFITSQSSAAHLILFTRIFAIAEADTGTPVRFHHIHGLGFQTWIADAHKGQALGAGMFCQQLCENCNEHCQIETSRYLKDLSPYDHLRRFYRLCTVHFKRNIHELRNFVTPEVLSAMYSLSSSAPLPDFDGTCNIIKNGGPKAAAWLKDKIDAKFVIPAIYRPRSLISSTHWLASPPSTNGNEQSHRNINRDGIELTLLGGICRGLQYDFRSMAGMVLHSTYGIYNRDKHSTDYQRSQKAITRQVLAQRRTQNKNKITKATAKPTMKRSTKRIPKKQRAVTVQEPQVQESEISSHHIHAVE